MSLHDFTGWIPNVLIFHSGEKMKGFSWMLSSGCQSLQVPVTRLKNNLWTLFHVCKSAGQQLLSCSVPLRSGVNKLLYALKNI